MYVIITGAGSFGLGAAEKIQAMGHEIAFVDRDPDKIHTIAKSYDCKTVLGSATSAEVLLEAGLEKADMLLAMTNDDHANIVTGLVAREYNVQRRIAKLVTQDFFHHYPVRLKGDIFHDIINPEEAAAEEFLRLFDLRNTSDVQYFAGDQAACIAYRITEDGPLTGKAVGDLKQVEKFGTHLKIAAIERYEKASETDEKKELRTIIADGQKTIESGDMVYIVGSRKDVEAFTGSNQVHNSKTCILVGGGSLALRIAKRLEGIMKVKVIEEDRHKCEILSSQLERAMVLHASGSDASLLKAERVDNCEAFITATLSEEKNILMGIHAKQLGAQKSYCLVQQREYVNMLPNLGIDAAISPKAAAISAITRIVENIETAITFKSDQLEAYDFTVEEGSPLTTGPLREIGLPEGVMIGGRLKRKGFSLFGGEPEFEVVSGETTIQAGDRVILFTVKDRIEKARSFIHGS